MLLESIITTQIRCYTIHSYLDEVDALDDVDIDDDVDTELEVETLQGNYRDYLGACEHFLDKTFETLNRNDKVPGINH